MAEQYRIAVIGSGPGGLSAAGRAAALGISHILLEKTDHASDTIYKYQKGKLVMATPDNLDLRSDFDFGLGVREEILDRWDAQIAELGVNIRYNAEVTGVSGSKGDFTITLADGSQIKAENVILAIGLQGNIRRLEVEGAAEAEKTFLQYQLDDPDEYEAETIVVIGAGDAAIENAVALARDNRVIIVNRRDEFARAKQGNLTLITQAIEKGDIECYYNSTPLRLGDHTITLKTPEGEVEIKCDRVIARLGAIPPRRFVESCGVVFPNDNPATLPEVSGRYESNVEGLFIIGALGGYPLIKQAMNQGYEVVEYLNGNTEIKPADEPRLEEIFAPWKGVTVDEALATIRANVPLFAEINPLMLRELMLDSAVHTPEPGDVIFSRGDFTNTFWTVVEGEVGICVDADDPDIQVPLGKGEFFGEMGLIAGRPRTATVVARENCVLVETGRRSMIKLINSVDAVKAVIDRTAIVRQIQTYLAPELTREQLRPVVEQSSIHTFAKGDVLFEEGAPGDALYLVRRGSVTVSRRIGGREIVLSYVASGNYVGEMALLSDAPRSATVRAAIDNTEVIRIEAAAFQEMLAQSPQLRAAMDEKFRERIEENERMASLPEAGGIIEFLVEQGVGEATDVLLIDEALCVRCDNCEKACAETHGGLNRLNREAGPTFANLHVPTSCRHCEHPHCMADCPPDAIHRGVDGEVYIDDTCIACGNCVRNCPYGVIRLAAPPKRKPGLLSWLLFGAGPGPGGGEADPEGKKRAVKCDMCKDIAGGASCVRACPTGAAIRVSPREFMNLAALARK